MSVPVGNIITTYHNTIIYHRGVADGTVSGINQPDAICAVADCTVCDDTVGGRMQVDAALIVASCDFGDVTILNCYVLDIMYTDTI